MVTALERAYQPRHWARYAVTTADPKPPTGPSEEFEVFTTDSAKARIIDERLARTPGADTSRYLLWDLELAAADVDPAKGGTLQRLTAAWRGHPADALTLCVYDGPLDGDYGNGFAFTYLIETPAEGTA